jgi:hypothetical protein
MYYQMVLIVSYYLWHLKPKYLFPGKCVMDYAVLLWQGYKIFSERAYDLYFEVNF